MSQDRPNAEMIGYGKDELGFSAEVLRDTRTGGLLLAYSPEVWWERCRYIAELEAMRRREQQEAIREH